MARYEVTDQSGSWSVEIGADTPKKAADECFGTASYYPMEETYWITLSVVDKDDPDGGNVDRYDYQVEPEAPSCRGNAEHLWVETYVRSQGRGMLHTDTCVRCKRQRVTDTYANGPDGRSGHYTSVRYENPDKA